MVKESFKKFSVACRHLQCVYLFACTAILYAIRSSLSVAIIPITAIGINDEKYDWSEAVKSHVLGAFFWGYTITQIPGGFLAEKYGAKYVLVVCTFVCSLLSLLTPYAISMGNWPALLVVRATTGLFQGVMYPACHVIISKWAPLDERGVLATISYSGSSMGVIVMTSTSGVIATKLGWPHIFHIVGAIGMGWCVVWIIFGGSSPAKCRFVSLGERQYIESSQMGTIAVNRPPTPWRKIFTSKPFYGIIVADATCQWGMTMIFAQSPRYTSGVHGVTVEENAIITALPYVLFCILGFSFCAIADILERRKVISTTLSRKIFNTIGLVVPALAVLGLSFTRRNKKFMASALLMVTYGFNSGVYIGFLINHIDISPNFAGTLMGVSNTISNVFASISQAVVSSIVKDATNPKEWRIVFLVTSSLFLVGAVFFLIFGKATVQSWNSSLKTETDRLTSIRKVPKSSLALAGTETMEQVLQ